jgi:hypothetical protein
MLAKRSTRDWASIRAHACGSEPEATSAPTAQGTNENDGGPAEAALPIKEAVSRSQNFGRKPERATVRSGAGYGNLE